MTEGSERHEAAPEGLSPAATQLWDDVVALHPLDVLQLVTLTKICLAKDQLDRMDAVLRGEVDTWTRPTAGTGARPHVVTIDAVLSQANTTANLFRQLIASLRLPDEVTGKRPQKRNGVRNAPVGKLGTVSSLDWARQNARR